MNCLQVDPVALRGCWPQGEGPPQMLQGDGPDQTPCSGPVILSLQRPRWDRVREHTQAPYSNLGAHSARAPEKGMEDPGCSSGEGQAGPAEGGPEKTPASWAARLCMPKTLTSQVRRGHFFRAKVGAQRELQHLYTPSSSPTNGAQGSGTQTRGGAPAASPALRSPRPGGSDQGSWAAQFQITALFSQS